MARQFTYPSIKQIVLFSYVVHSVTFMPLLQECCEVFRRRSVVHAWRCRGFRTQSTHSHLQ